LIEDIAIAYGYNNIEPVLPKVPTIGGLSEEEKLGTKIRELMVGLGFQEILTFTLTNEENIFKKMNIENREVVRISNPVSNEYEICRDWLLPSLLKVLTMNKHREYPQMIFELGECIVLDEKEETKTRSVKKLTGVISHDNANLTEMKSVIEAISRSEGKNYSFKPYNHPSFIESRCGEIVCNEKNIGFFGEVSPIVLENWKLEKPVIAFEIEI
jgi:phenylalanyl-tRNA synthetase beta chain